MVIKQVKVHTLFLHDGEGGAELTPVSTSTKKSDLLRSRTALKYVTEVDKMCCLERHFLYLCNVVLKGKHHLKKKYFQRGIFPCKHDT